MSDFTGLDVDLDSAALRRGTPGRGRSASTGTEVTRQLGESDIASLAVRRPAPASALAKVRDIHHSLARFLAEGKRDVEVAALTGYSPEYIRVLKGDPAFKELLGFYRRNVEAAYADMHERLKMLGLSATAEMIQRLATDPDKLTDETLVTLIKTSADRTGHGPQAKGPQVNINVGMADRMAQARERSQRSKTATDLESIPNRAGLPAKTAPDANQRHSEVEDAQVIEHLPLPAPGRDNPGEGSR